MGVCAGCLYVFGSKTLPPFSPKNTFISTHFFLPLYVPLLPFSPSFYFIFFPSLKSFRNKRITVDNILVWNTNVFACLFACSCAVLFYFIFYNTKTKTNILQFFRKIIKINENLRNEYQNRKFVWNLNLWLYALSELWIFFSF